MEYLCTKNYIKQIISVGSFNSYNILHARVSCTGGETTTQRGSVVAYSFMATEGEKWDSDSCLHDFRVKFFLKIKTLIAKILSFADHVRSVSLSHSVSLCHTHAQHTHLLNTSLKM